MQIQWDWFYDLDLLDYDGLEIGQNLDLVFHLSVKIQPGYVVGPLKLGFGDHWSSCFLVKENLGFDALVVIDPVTVLVGYVVHVWGLIVSMYSCYFYVDDTAWPCSAVKILDSFGNNYPDCDRYRNWDCVVVRQVGFVNDWLKFVDDVQMGCVDAF